MNRPLSRSSGFGFFCDDLLVALEEPVEEPAQHLVDHLLLGGEVVIEAAGQDSGRVGDVAHGRRPQPTLGEHRRRELEKLVPPTSWLAHRLTGCG